MTLHGTRAGALGTAAANEASEKCPRALAEGELRELLHFSSSLGVQNEAAETPAEPPSAQLVVREAGPEGGSLPPLSVGGQCAPRAGEQPASAVLYSQPPMQSGARLASCSDVPGFKDTSRNRAPALCDQGVDPA